MSFCVIFISSHLFLFGLARDWSGLMPIFTMYSVCSIRNKSKQNAKTVIYVQVTGLLMLEEPAVHVEEHTSNQQEKSVT
jgi:NADH:ubiquinone oxidoreductase subunit 4 (subunit M)